MAYAGAELAAPVFDIQSYIIRDNDFMPAAQANGRCGGENISPDLRWTGAPYGTRSFALVVHDPDSSARGGYFHWIVIDIPPYITNIEAGATFARPARAIENDFGLLDYGGPCPPAGLGPHRYHFTIYALDVEKLELTPDLTPRQVVDIIKDHAVMQATITGLYERD